MHYRPPERACPRVFERYTREDGVTFAQGERVAVAGWGDDWIIDFFTLQGDTVCAWTRRMTDEVVERVTSYSFGDRQKMLNIRLKDVNPKELSHVEQTPKAGLFKSSSLMRQC